MSDHLTEASDCTCPSAGGAYAGYFPNLVVRTHENRLALFYNDLLRGKVVMLHCMSVASEAVYPVLDNLVQVQRLLGDRLGREVFMYSLTVDPVHDTPQVLREVAARYSIGPGWWLLTSTVDVMQTLRRRLFASVDGLPYASAQDGALGLLRYGNEPVGLWGAVPAKTAPAQIVQRLEWVTPRQGPLGAPRRRGPGVPEVMAQRS
jgi:protein SCO1/2